MLRDVLSSFERIGTWPCDEINFIWRHGNVKYPSDEIPATRATPDVSRYIRAKFDALSRAKNLELVVEKTCANSLRVPFIEKVLPEARYIFIYRDGIDATGSAKHRWTAPVDLSYIFAKARYVPLADLPYYAMRFFWSRIYRIFSSNKRLAFWGPTLSDMSIVLENHDLNEVCAIQWQRCVEAAENAFLSIPADRVLKVAYEEFVSHPFEELSRILSFLDYSADIEQMKRVVTGVSANSLGKGRSELGPEAVYRLELLVGDSLKRYGYI
jgi:hypothetical protein